MDPTLVRRLIWAFDPEDRNVLQPTLTETPVGPWRGPVRVFAPPDEGPETRNQLAHEWHELIF